MEVSIDEPLNVDWDGNELLLSDILGTDENVIYNKMEEEVNYHLLYKALAKLSREKRQSFSFDLAYERLTVKKKPRRK